MEELSRLQDPWEKLVEQAASATVYQTWQWNSCWWRSFGHAHRLLLVTCYRGAELVGIAPMLRVGTEGGDTSGQGDIRFIGCPNNATDYPDFIVHPQAPEALGILLDALVTELRGYDRLWLTRYRDDFENRRRVLEWLRRNGAGFVSVPDLPAPYRKLGDPVADRRAASKAALRRNFNHLRREGRLEFQVCKEPAEALNTLDAFFDQHVARWAQTRWPSQFLQPDQRHFYRELVPALMEHQWLHFAVLRLDGAPIAFHFGFEHRNRLLYYKPAFDPRYAQFSPGKVLIKYLLEDLISRHLDEFDFTVGGEAYKYRFANAERLTHRIVVFRSRRASTMYRVQQAVRQRVRGLRQNGRNILRRLQRL